jgi:hypothetical protein
MLDTGGEFRRRRGATLIRTMSFACNDDSRQSQSRVLSIFLSSATDKHSRIASIYTDDQFTALFPCRGKRHEAVAQMLARHPSACS